LIDPVCFVDIRHLLAARGFHPQITHAYKRLLHNLLLPAAARRLWPEATCPQLGVGSISLITFNLNTNL
jgi:hypothetical protein